MRFASIQCSAPPDLLAGFKGPLRGGEGEGKGRERRGEGEGKGKEGQEGRGRGRGGEVGTGPPIG